MSDADGSLKELFEAEGVPAETVDDLVSWARMRVSEVMAAVAEDPELGPLLEPGGTGGEVIDLPRQSSSRAEAAGSPAQEVPPEDERTQPRPTEEAPQSLPPVPQAGGQAAAPAPDEDDEIEEIEEIEELDMDELELIEDGDEAEGEEQEAAAPAPEQPSFGPPDGTEDVPAWRAALFSAQSGDDAEAARMVKEESHVGPNPADLPVQPQSQPTQRLEAEEEEISHHAIDLSDLDGDEDE